MTVEQILALSSAGFSAEQITNMISALGSEQPEQQQEEPQEQPEQQDVQQEQEQPEQHEQPEDATPAWFNKFLQKYNADYEQIARGIQAKNVRRAGSDDPGAQLKTPEQLMAEAYNNIR